MKTLERKKVLEQFDDAGKNTSPKYVQESRPVKTVAAAPNASKETNRKYVDADSKEEYLDLSSVNKKDGDAFDKLNEMTKRPSSQDVKKATQAQLKAQAKQLQSSRTSQKAGEDDEVFEKLKTMTKQIKKK